MSEIDMSAIDSEKESLRNSLLEAELPPLPKGAWGKMAERMRHVPAYVEARSVMVAPAPILNQVRINVLADRKHLVLPTPGVQKGFLHIDPNRTPVKRWAFAVRSIQANQVAEKMLYGKLQIPPIDLIVVDVLAAGRDGSLLGNGQGHLDLQYAALYEMGWLHTGVRVIAVVEDERVLPTVPAKDTDVGAHWIITPGAAYETGYGDLPSRGIVWDWLDRKRIRRNDAVFHLFQKRMPR